MDLRCVKGNYHYENILYIFIYVNDNDTYLRVSKQNIKRIIVFFNISVKTLYR